MAPAPSNKRSSDSGPSTPNNRRTTSDIGPSMPKNRGVSAGNDSSSPKQPSISSDAEEKPPYESPLKRVRRAIARVANKRVIDTVGDLKAFIAKEDPTNCGVPASVAASIVLRMRVVWTSLETGTTGPVARLHLVDLRVDDDLEDMHKVFKDDYAKKRGIVDSELVTASLYGEDGSSAGMPADGATIFISRMWTMKLFAKQSCQLSTSVDSIRVEVP